MAKRDEYDARRLRIVSDGTSVGTTIYCGNEPVSNAVRVEWSVKVDDLARATVHFENVPVEVVGEDTAAEQLRKSAGVLAAIHEMVTRPLGGRVRLGRKD